METVLILLNFESSFATNDVIRLANYTLQYFVCKVYTGVKHKKKVHRKPLFH